MSKVYIYSLGDPRTKEIRYVGKTIKNPEMRLREHLARIENQPQLFCLYPVVRWWFYDLWCIGLRPILKVEEECSQADYASRELFWIRYYLDLGCDLLNTHHTWRGLGGNDRLRNEKQAHQARRTQGDENWP